MQNLILKANSSGMKQMWERFGITFCCPVRKNFPMFISSFKWVRIHSIHMLQQSVHSTFWHYYSQMEEQKCNIKQQWCWWQYASMTICGMKGKNQKLSTQHSISTWKREEEKWCIRKRSCKWRRRNCWLNLRLLKAKVRMKVKVRRKVKVKMKMDFQKTLSGYFNCNLYFLGTFFVIFCSIVNVSHSIFNLFIYEWNRCHDIALQGSNKAIAILTILN